MAELKLMERPRKFKIPWDRGANECHSKILKKCVNLGKLTQNGLKINKTVEIGSEKILNSE